MFCSIDTLLFILGIISSLFLLNVTIKDFQNGTYNPFSFGYSKPFNIIVVIIIIFPMYFIENRIYDKIYSIIILSIALITETFFCSKMYLREKKLKYLLACIFLIVVYSVFVMFFIKFVIAH